ncbi:MAG: arylsulfatase, partial [Verrucomicrobiae bacterium]|nr:arylsulfatase [Verrucomicrobiae bacterium]
MNQLPLWLGETQGPIRDHAIHNTFEDVFALRQDNWVLVDAKSGEHSRPTAWYTEHSGYVRDAPEGAWLFNLGDDLAQRKNRFKEQPERAARMQAELKSIREGERTAER